MKFNKKLSLLLSVGALTVAPIFIVASCKKEQLKDSNKIDKKPEIKQPDESKNKEQEKKNDSSINKKTNLSEKFSLDLSQIYNSEKKKYYSPEKIFTSTNLYKKSLIELDEFLKEQGSNFDANTLTNSKKFLEKIKNIGTYGNYGSTPEEKINYYTEYNRRSLMTEAKYLDRFEKIDEGNSITMTNGSTFEKIKGIIKDNPFGFLPSNLSQFFYYIQLDTIKGLLDFPEKIQDIKANYDDKVGSINLLIITPNNKYKYEFNRENSELKNDNDFYKYIHERTFSLGFQYLVTKQDQFGGSSRIREEGSSGTAWVLDRIENPNVPRGSYEFVIATNAHVLNWASAFDRSRSNHYFKSDQEREDWFGGFSFEEYSPSNKEIKQSGKFNKTYERITNLPKTHYEYLSRPVHSKNLFSPDYDFSKNEFVDVNQRLAHANIWRSYLDMILYTPQFDSESIRTRKDNANLFFKPGYDKNKRIGTTPYGGGDIVLTKWRLTRNEIKELFPTLFPLLETEEEKDWYIGLGNEDSDSKELESVIQTHFAGGYPINRSNDDRISFKVTKSTGGTIVTQPRIVDDSEFLDLWVRYDKNKNKKFNPLNEDWKNYEKPFVKSIEHGMRLRVLNQLPVMYMKNDFALDSGSSGSMVINSRFNVIGINFLNVEELDNPNSKGNALVLFKSPNKYKPDQFSGDIKKDFIKLLKDKNIKTVKMNN
ncbi:hypothetical protein DA803_02635 [[Mycoplasma] phocae]|uniref:DUF31 domain-containing protein n=1 Tax=[Mycoplasma] phocae TaxID=142651 RepID=A0A2Z5IRJ7_9BACT|nr:hypothetical protein [[Mycoplasma] phocae]AXE60966.1 hypothetical protein DA803_02635 [[Mycoplasma] phocae]